MAGPGHVSVGQPVALLPKRLLPLEFGAQTWVLGKGFTATSP